MRRVFASVLGVVVVALIACTGDDPDRVGPAGTTDGGGGSSGGSSGGDSSPGNNDGGGDGDGEAPSVCWPFNPAHFDPCVARFDTDHPNAGPKAVGLGEIINTDAAPDTITKGASTYAFYRFASLTVPSTVTLTIRGSVPAVIMVDGDVTIDGKILVSPTTSPPSVCAKLDALTTMTNCTNGGPGGGYGGNGGNGGSGGMGGPANGNPKNDPLRAGCPGGTSATPKPESNSRNACANPAMGGPGGGALAISAHGKISISATGSITANGAGGGAGDANPPYTGINQTSNGQSCDSGGGGGGSGGSIVVEANEVTIKGSVCAVGGGGGSGGQEGGVKGSTGVTSTTCAIATGGTTGIAGGAGGAIAEAVNGTASPSCGYTSGGGGGGSYGRIRIRSSATKDIATGSIAPKASEI